MPVETPVDAFPLAWPTGWARTDPADRTRAQFKVTETRAALSPEKAGAKHRKAMTKLLESMSPRWRTWDAFNAFIESAAVAIANAATLQSTPQWREREDRYAQITQRFGEDAEAFPRLLAHLTSALTVEPRDQLGLLASELEVLSKGHGQYFTPFEVSRFMAALTLDNDQTREHIERHGFVTIHEPAAGAGGMVIAAAHTLRDMGFNPQAHLHATCWDIEDTAAHMCYVQLSLLGIPAVVVLGNTLTLEARQVLETPAHIWGLWRYRLAKRGDEADAPHAHQLGPLAEQQALFAGNEASP